MNCKIVYTLVFVKNTSQILLGLKKRGLGQGKWNGFGGKVEKNETLEQGAIREIKEESDLTVNHLNHVGVLLYEILHKQRIDVVHVYTANEYSGSPIETDEMKPEWFDIKNIPYENMWPDARLWHPYMLNDKYFVAHIVYKNEDEYIKPNITEYESITDVLNTVKKIKFNYF